MSVCTTGGQGCVFFKELECVDSTQNHANRDKYVSKLQRDENTVYEYSIISYINRLIPKYVPDYTKYTILNDITKCVPLKTQAEIQKMCPKCTIPYAKNSNVSMMNIPYKGLPLDQVMLSTTLIPDLWKATRYTTVTKIYTKAVKYYSNASIPVETIKDYISNPDVVQYIHIEYSIKTLNNRLIDAFSKIVKIINKLGIYHSDIKASNILIDLPSSPSKYDFHNANIYIIDWGVSNLSTINTINMNRPLCIPILNPSFMGYFNTYYKTVEAEKIVYTYFTANPIVITGHVTILNDSLNILTGISSGYICGLHPSWFSHLVTWLKYVKNHSLTFDNIKSVVLHNKDIVGFISVYVTIYLTIHYNYVVPTNKKYPDKIQIEAQYDPIYKFYKRLGKICFKVLVETYTKLNPDQIIEGLTELNSSLITPTK